MKIDLVPTECEILAEILQAHLNDLQVQIHHAANYQFKQGLKARERVVAGLVERLQKREAAAAADPGEPR